MCDTPRLASSTWREFQRLETIGEVGGTANRLAERQVVEGLSLSLSLPFSSARLFPTLYLSLSACLFVHPFLWWSISFPVYLCLYLILFLSRSLSLDLSIWLSVYPPIPRWMCVCVCLSLYLSPSLFLFLYSSIYVSIHLSSFLSN